APRFDPSPTTRVSAGWVAGSTPDSASSAIQWMVTSSLYHPAALGAVVATPVRLGGVRSMLACTVAWLVLPATSSASPTTAWFAPSSVSVVSPEQDFTPDSSSEHWKLTVTSELFHPKPLGAGEADPVMDGGMPSICRVMA